MHTRCSQSSSAGQDYIKTAQLLTFNENTAYIPVAMVIINNGYYQDDIIFQANLGLQSAGGYEQFVTLSPAMATATIIDDINGNVFCLCVSVPLCMCT